MGLVRQKFDSNITTFKVELQGGAICYDSKEGMNVVGASLFFTQDEKGQILCIDKEDLFALRDLVNKLILEWEMLEKKK